MVKAVHVVADIVNSRAVVLAGLINNAGAFQQQIAEAVEMDEARYIFEVNLFGVMRLTQLFLPKIRKFQARIVNVGNGFFVTSR